jgi:Type II restriction endonuclease, TdeIII
MKSLFPEIRLAAILERSLNTALGWGWDKIAGDIARTTHGNAEVGHFVEGQIPASTASHIDAICIGYTSGDGHGVPDTAAELAAILPGVTAPGAREDIREKDDVFYVATDGVENHIEIKTPKPNYDQMRAAKRRILRIHSVRAPKKVRAFVGMPYNPNGFYGEYGWPTTKYFVDDSQDLLVGEKFWNYIGSSNHTYEELMDCFLAVSEHRRKELVFLLEGGV